ncbi:DUF4123 domain-containing protein [Pseudorhodobacter sp. E13]|uniref:DUF4123 domain-containing protein n=1 Tax=Pseudorhodobacter sp. E13 TaxID=2487931 RepID=UPI000F8F3376|nr:DUF4123 domain-containing protein [Pseudorhodobacter sp. E13]RUS65016.1 DUF4123 domain-containing protein [Pseudorhodobacter sp. E13]
MSPLAPHLLALASRHPVFAVLDGAHFENLPVRLQVAGFYARPLFQGRDRQDPTASTQAPWLVALDESSQPFRGRPPEATIPDLLQILGERPAAVFWSCDDGFDALYRHLRGLNVILYPKVALTTYEARFVQGEEVAPLFRHADANVMAQVEPSLGPSNRARLFGPAQALSFVPAPAWRTKDVHVAIAEAATPPRGQLRLTPEEAAAIARRYRQGVAHLIAGGYAPPYHDRVRAAVLRAANYEIDLMEQLEIFVKLDLAYGPRFEHEPRYAAALAQLQALDRAPDTRLDYAAAICRKTASLL